MKITQEPEDEDDWDWDTDEWLLTQSGAPPVEPDEQVIKKGDVASLDVFYEPTLDGEGFIDRRLWQLDLWKLIDQIPIERLRARDVRCLEHESLDRSDAEKYDKQPRGYGGPRVRLIQGEEYLDVVAEAIRKHCATTPAIPWPGKSLRCYVRIERDELVLSRIPGLRPKRGWRTELAWRSDISYLVAVECRQ